MNELKRILVAEDEDNLRTIIQIALEDIGGFTIKLCRSGYEVLKEVEAFAPDLIVLDMMMPGMDGIATLLELRKLEKFKNTPVVFLTAKIQRVEVAHFREMGAIDVITKPFEPMILASTLQTIWDQQNGQ